VDRLQQAIDRIARDVASKMLPLAPVLIAGPTTRSLLDEPSTIDQAVLDHGSYLDAVEAVGDDSALGHLAPKGSRGPMFAAGDTWRQLSADALVPSLIASAASELRARGIKPSPDELSAVALLNVQRCRDIAVGKQPEVVNVLGFSGIEMSTDQPIELPWGTFRARNGWYGVAEVLRFRPTTCVLIAHHPLPVELMATPPRESKAHTIHEQWRETTTRLVVLSIVFGTHDSAVAPLPTFQLTVLPFEAPFSAGAPMILAPPAGQRELGEAELAEVVRWSEILKQRYKPRLDVVARRLIAALAHRIDPADRLIDAVTAWEALFGGRQEATLRVSGSIAWLLEPANASARQLLRDEASGIYDLRSKVVHGETVDVQKVYSASARATELGIASLRRILEGRPELIALESTDRSRRLLFEGPVALTPP
jgi:hypothetical protein